MPKKGRPPKRPEPLVVDNTLGASPATRRRALGQLDSNAQNDQTQLTVVDQESRAHSTTGNAPLPPTPVSASTRSGVNLGPVLQLNVPLAINESKKPSNREYYKASKEELEEFKEKISELNELARRQEFPEREFIVSNKSKKKTTIYNLFQMKSQMWLNVYAWYVVL
jgi:hypothetical protein